MELDLDAFLDSHLSDDDSDENFSRTVDEILLNDSSDSSSPSSPTRHSPTRTDDPTANSKTLSPHQTSSQFILNSEHRSVQFSPDVASTSLNRTRRNVLPVLFGSSSVRSSVKPGAALAAAAAASRSAPTPHAAAIKLRRAATTPVVPPYVEESGGLDSDAVSEPLAIESQLSSGKSDFDDVVSAQAGYVTPIDEIYSSPVTESNIRDSYTDEVDEALIQTEWEVANVSDTNESTLDNLEEVSVSPILETHITPAPSITNEAQSSEDYCINSSEISSDDADTKSLITESVDNADQYNNGRIVEEGLTSIPNKREAAGLPHTEEAEEVNQDGDATIYPIDGSEHFKDSSVQLENKVESEGPVKKSHTSMTPLELAEELEKNAFAGSRWKELADSQPMRLEGVQRGSTVLGYFDVDVNNAITRTISSEAFRKDHGVAQVLAVHHNFIAVGMSKGSIVCFPSKKPTPHVNNDAKVVILGTQGDKSHASVMSMCFNRQGDILFAGYADGRYTVWDIQKSNSLKTIKEHKAAVVHILYIGHDSQASRQFTVVSGDSKGVIKLIQFSIVPWVNRINTKQTLTLLDESTSKVVCASLLLSDEYSGGSPMSAGSATVNNSSIGSMMGGVVGGDWKLFEGSSLVEEGVVIFVTHQAALVAKVNPSIEVYAKILRPDGVREGSMPYASWKYMGQPCCSSNENMPEKMAERVGLLALAWDRKVQVAELVKSKLKISSEWTLESSALGVAWLDDELLVVLTSDGQLRLFAKDGNVIHQTSFAVDGAQGDDVVAYHSQFADTSGNPEKAYHNCVAIWGASIYILGPVQLTISRLLPWKERIEVLRKAGDWIGALNMAISLYDSKPLGVIDFPRSLDEARNTVMPYLIELLLSYVDEVFSYISVALSNQIGKLDQDDSGSSSSVHSEIQEQFTRVGGVAVEFCLRIKRTDILFDDILSRFVSVQHKETFLELLEPYILKDKFGSLPPEIMQALVEHYSMKGWLQRVEQCVLHMDISSLDFNQVVRLCREHRLYGALIYLFNRGLDDFRAPLEELLFVLQNSQKDIAAPIGYKMLVYLKYCFSGHAFPPAPGQGVLSSTRLKSVRIELVQFLLEDSSIPNSLAPASLNFTGACTNVYHLLFLDTQATLDVLKCAFVDDEITIHPSPDSAHPDMDSTKEYISIQSLCQKMVNALALIIDKGYPQTDGSFSDNDVESNGVWPSKNDICHVIEFVAYYVSCRKTIVSKNILSKILMYLTSTSDDSHPIVSQQNLHVSREREKQVLQILEVVPETDWDASFLLNLCEKAQFYQVCGLIHAIRHQNLAAIESYMKDADEPIFAFFFISYTLLQLRGKEADVFQSEILSRIPDLVKLSRECTFLLIVEHFSGDHDRALFELESRPESLFLYLKTVIEVHTTGTLNFSCLRKGDNVKFPSGRRDIYQPNRIEAYVERTSEFSKLMRNNPVHVTDKIVEQYLELLCQYEPSSVLKFLETFENYRVEHCLRLCQNYGIVDAAAFLLERVGDVGTALSFTISVLDDKFTMLDATVQTLVSENVMEHFNTFLQKKEVNEILDIVHACIGLCQRNSPRMDFDESESLWFRLLDSFCEPLIDSYNDQYDSGGILDTKSLSGSLDGEENKAVHRIRWKLSRSKRGARVLRKLFSVFIREIVEGMVGYVRLPTIMMKLLSDNGSQEFGDFKLTILGMLGTYDFERRILDTAKSLIEDDTYYTMSQLKKGASHGYGPRSLLCCICNCPLTRNSTSSRIQVFNCGHTTHLQCELQEKDASSGVLSAGCPICIPKKNAQSSKSKSTLAEQGSWSRSLSRHQPPQGSGLHPHESEAAEGSYGYHSISRFEILSSLRKDHTLYHVENMPHLRLAPPALYHEKVKKGINNFSGESSSRKVKDQNDLSRDSFAKMKKTSKTKQLRESKGKGSSIQFPLKSNIFGREKISRR